MTEAEDTRGRTRYLRPHFVAGKVRQHGLSWCFRRATSRGVRPARRILGRLAWVIPVLRFLLRPLPPAERRILAIWDFRSQPYSIGDLLLLQEVGLALCHQYEVGLVDVCLLAEQRRPARPSFTAIGVNASNYVDQLLSLFPVILAGRHIAELHYFDSHHNLEQYTADNAYRYHVWPDGIAYASGSDLSGASFAFLAEFYQKYEFLPVLSLRPALLDWARSFLSKTLAHGIPIVVQLRNTGSYSPDRDSDIDTWVEFFELCKGVCPACFVVICAKSEVDERLRGLPNVVVAKDFDTRVDQDLALIQCAPAYMGMSSGPAAMAIFGRKPYSLFRAFLNDLPTEVIVEHPWGSRFLFAEEHQRCMFGPETVQMLADECARLISAIDAPSWQESLGSSSKPPDDVPLRLG